MKARWLLLLVPLGCGTPAQPKPCDTFERSCAADADCAVLNHQVDCCGSQVVIGVSAGQLAADQARELSCVADAPRCRCLARAPVAEDGKEILDGASLQVRCVGGACVTSVK